MNTLFSRGRQRVSVSLVLVLAATVAWGREQVPLNTEWRFALNPAGDALAGPGFDDTRWTHVTLPYSWNGVDGGDGGSNYVRGDGWYRRHFATDPAWLGQRVYLECGGANRVAEVWLNGTRLGEHRGGYSRFRFDLTPQLKPSGDNVLAIRVNNTANGIVPLGGDFTWWGGLHRDVSLLVVPAVHVALLDHASSGVYLTTTALTADSAEVRARILVENAGTAAATGSARVLVRDASGTLVAEAAQPWRAEAGQTATVEPQFRVRSPHRWQGRADPYVYRVTVELRTPQGLLDAVEQPLGFRTLQVDPNAGLLLNGHHLAVHGVNRHQDWKDHGLALTRDEQRRDFALIEELGANAVRLCHYEHDDFAYALADADGLLVWAEVAFVGNPPNTDEGRDNAVEQLRELIRQNYNHPSIFCWSVGNETGANADALIARLAETAKQEDPSRFTTYASHHAPEDPRNFRTDLLGYNRYFGWYTGSYDELGPWLDAWHAKHPDRPLGLSEYGAGASIYQHEQSPPIRAKTQSHGPWHPEEWQNAYHEHAWLAIQARPYLWGTFIWNMFDFGVDSRKEGDTAGRNDKGLVTYDRLTRKDAFYWYKANWTEAPFVYLTSRRDVLRVEAQTDVKVYSNCDRVELWLNGESLGERTSPDHRFSWEGVTLKDGPNRLYVVGTKGDQRVSDSCGWTLTSGKVWRPAGE